MPTYQPRDCILELREMNYCFMFVCFLNKKTALVVFCFNYRECDGQFSLSMWLNFQHHLEDMPLGNICEELSEWLNWGEDSPWMRVAASNRLTSCGPGRIKSKKEKSRPNSTIHCSLLSDCDYNVTISSSPVTFLQLGMVLNTVQQDRAPLSLLSCFCQVLWLSHEKSKSFTD